MIQALTAVVCAVAVGAAPDAGQPEAAVEVKRPKVLLIGVDGMRVEAFLAADAPAMKGLMGAGCWTDEAFTDQHAISGAGWSNILTGVWPEKHGSPDNRFKFTRYEQYPHWFARLHQQRPDLKLGHFVSWTPIDQYILNRLQVDWRFSADNEKENGDIRATLDAEKCLREGDPDVVFLYQGDVDTTGHRHGFSRYAPEYMAEIADTDANIARVLAAVRARPGYNREDWLILLTSDHGGTLDKSHGRNDAVHRTIMFMAAGGKAAHGKLWRAVSQVDVAATVFDHLGVPVDPAWDWDGRPCIAPVSIKPGDNLLENAGGEWAAGVDDERTNTCVPAWRDWETITVVNYDRAPGVAMPPIGAPNRGGRGYFCGGTQVRSEMSQVVDVATLSADVDAGKLAVELGGWFGGVGERTDLALLEAAFIDEHGGVLGTVRVGAVTLAERREAFGSRPEGLSGMLERKAAADLPAGTRRIRVRLTAEGSGSGMNLGCADELWCVVKAKP